MTPSRSHGEDCQAAAHDDLARLHAIKSPDGTIVLSCDAAAALLIDVTGRQIARARLPYPIAHGLLERVRPARGASATIYRITAAGGALLARVAS